MCVDSPKHVLYLKIIPWIFQGIVPLSVKSNYRRQLIAAGILLLHAKYETRIINSTKKQLLTGLASAAYDNYSSVILLMLVSRSHFTGG